MHHILVLLLAFVCCNCIVRATTLDHVLMSTRSSTGRGSARNPWTAPHMRKSETPFFLHVTDFHLDPHYTPRSSVKSACHRPTSEADDFSETSKIVVGPYGAPLSFCDSPPKLIDLTFDHLINAHGSNISFIVYTGDAARHDADSKELPRGWDEIQELQRQITTRLAKLAAVSDVPVVPSIGNNDIPEHNTLPFSRKPGLNPILDFYSKVWSPFIPQEQRDVFRTLGSFYVRVRPDLVVVSLNTMYWFNMNQAVQDCELKRGRKSGKIKVSAGLALFRWLESEVLALAKRRDPVSGRETFRYKVMLTGHIPPNAFNFFPKCYSLYSDLSQRYSAILLPGLYGHMNLDHLLFLDPKESQYLPRAPTLEHFTTKQPFRSLAGASYLEYLMGHYERVYKLHHNASRLSGGRSSREDFGIAIVSSSVVPLYNPAYRIFSLSSSGDTGLYLRGYEQFFINLTFWNLEYARNNYSEAGLQPPVYEYAYSVNDLYDMKSLQPFAAARTAGKIQGEYCARLAQKFPPNPHRKLCHIYFQRWFTWYAVSTGATF